MAQLPEEITTTVLQLQRRLLAIIHKATATQFLLCFRSYKFQEDGLRRIDNF